MDKNHFILLIPIFSNHDFNHLEHMLRRTIAGVNLALELLKLKINQKWSRKNYLKKKAAYNKFQAEKSLQHERSFLHNKFNNG